MRKRGFFMSVAVLVASACNAENVIIETPSGEERTTAFGGVLWEKKIFDGAPGVIIGASVDASWGGLEHVSLPTGATLGIIRDKKLKACQGKEILRLGLAQQAIWVNCLVDEDDDGKFDRVLYNSNGFSKKLEPPVPYEKKIVPYKGDDTTATDNLILFSGATASEIRLSYREFINDMARPAFTEDLVIPLSSQFPQTVSVKNIRVSILKIDGVGMHYKVEK